MKLPVTAKYIGWLLFFMLLSAFLNFSVDVAHDIFVDGWNKEAAQDEARELLLFLIVNLSTMPVVIFIGWRVAKRMLKPIRAISETTEKIAEGELSARVDTDVAQDVLGKLARSINKAFDRYDDATERLRRFSSDASHQLRTPLTAIRSKGEISLNRKRTNEEYQETITSMLIQTEHLSHIVEQLLDLSRLDSSVWKQRFDPVDIVEILTRSAAEFEPLCEEKNIQLVLSTPQSFFLKGDASLLNQVFVNLLDNAIRYTPDEGTIQLVVKKEKEGCLSVHISDTGSGIPEEYRSRVFERFDQGVHTEHSGAGLGLAIVSEIIHVHGGHVEAVSNESGGATIRLELPISDSA